MKSVLALATLLFSASALAGADLSKVSIYTDEGTHSTTSNVGECVKHSTPGIPALIIEVQSKGRCSFYRQDHCLGDPELTMGEGARTLTRELKVITYKCE
ncbi:hypothetical protein BO94DRAFT_588404 [Aspergillus sclerotioniger CBS 115572]|uniref:Beta/gamma crystallin 'Greek key' domain-containing protein n=1 Tax=Aspergillus sclerotioniger CBS 115572 TaxID=1450535 RepID=A0A317VXN8_9EURO|nr:hypothetical protein BO94DRAFT_588404 [Aspergillus sclerotioniger CBS 115572]PWY78101.1 hypothetical protein BO94DRAFT_588404 [Aspergillus sclerotioniger CBS 115572]